MSWGGTGRGSGPDSKTNEIQTYYVPLMRNAADLRELRKISTVRDMGELYRQEAK